MSLMSKWLDHWDGLDPDAQRKWKIGGALLVLLVLAIGVQKVSKKEKTPFEKTKVESTMMLPDNSKMDMESLHSEVYRLGRENQDMKRLVEQQNTAWAERFKTELEDAKKQGVLNSPETDTQLNELKEELARLKAQQALSPTASTGARPTGRNTGPDMAGALPSPNMYVNATNPPSYEPALQGQGTGGAATSPEAAAQAAAPAVGLRLSSGENSKGEASGGTASSGDASKEGSTGPTASGAAAPAVQSAKEETAYIPAGSILRGVLLSGLDAPTSSYTQKNPMPAAIRVKHQAILPNFYKYDIRECFIIASGYGVLSTERVSLRTETLSCVRNDGGVIETQLQGYIVGEDGKAGMRGKLVQRQGQLIARSLMAGVFSGLANAARPQAIAAVNTTPGTETGYQTPNMGDALASGIGQGASNSLDQIAQYYLDAAKSVFPVIQLDAGRSVEVILVKGSTLKMKGKESSGRRGRGRS